ncbi:MAG: NAD-dependent epimerase/dehydratase family protein [Dehalococcoidia bacterium]
MLEKYKRAAVTGGAGFIGSFICDYLLDLGKDVLVIDDLSTGKQENIPNEAEFVQIDITDRDGMEQAASGMELVFHLAAQPSTRASMTDPWLDFKSNVLGTYIVLESSLDEVAHYTRAILNHQPIIVFGDGNQSRDFVNVKDVARAHLLAAEVDPPAGQALNIGTGIEVTINDLIATIEEVTGRKARIEWNPWPAGDIYREYADVRSAERLLGYQAQTSLRSGIEEMVEWFEQELT